MRRALDEYFIGGIKTNLPLFRRILEHPDFVAARLDTGLLDRMLASKAAADAASNGLAEMAAVSAALFAAIAPARNGANGSAKANGDKKENSNWKRIARTEALRSE
jgi:acetyl-CoA carboxylase biotin carboxylase subunit